jgi:NAD-dependent SIR2 family protein deacetylase
MQCIHCQTQLDPDRALFLAETGRPMVCQRCSGEGPRLTLMEYGHKTAGYLVVVPRGDEAKAMRAFKRSR